jgi:hypothetical protein
VHAAAYATDAEASASGRPAGAKVRDLGRGLTRGVPVRARWRWFLAYSFGAIQPAEPSGYDSIAAFKKLSVRIHSRQPA